MRLAALLVLLLIPGSAAADVVGPEEPLSCPDGAQATTNHCGTNCWAPTCTSDADCESGERCATVPYCVEVLMCGRGGAGFDAIRDTCAGGCAEGTCTDIRTCFDASRVEPDGTVMRENVTYGCGCRAAPGSSAGGALLLGLLGGLLWRRR